MHIFLTGAKQVGKSTLLRAILAQCPGTVGGFLTLRLNTYLPGQYTVHLMAPGQPGRPTKENFLFQCGKGRGDPSSRFDLLGCAALENIQNRDLIVMDELGPHEAQAERFQTAVLQALDGDIPILGVLQAASSPFLEVIARHPKVHILCVTEENREELASRIPEYLEILTERT